MGEIFNLILVNPIINILVVVYKSLFFLHIPYALGFAIIVLTIIIRFIMYPLISAQLKSSKKMQALSPHLSRIKEKHKGDAKTLQSATMSLYKEHGVNPAAGCLPVIIQLPIIWALYSVLQKIVGLDPKSVVSEINKLVYFDFIKLDKTWDPSFFGLPLGQNPSQTISTIGPLVLLLPFATGFFQFIQSKMMISKPEEVKGVAKVTDKKKEDFATAFQTQSLYIFPVMIGFFSYNFPIGLSLYWITFTIFGIIQQYKISGLGGLRGWVDKIHG
jgi:YidC/Oxa1 family membrane protein insertase